MGMNSWLHSSKADGNFDEQTLTDDLSERQSVNIMNDSCYNTSGLHKMLSTMLTTYVVYDFFFFYLIQDKESEANVLALGNP